MNKLNMYICRYLQYLVLQLHNNENSKPRTVRHGLWLLCEHPCHAPKERPTTALRQKLQAPAIHGPKEGTHIALLICEPLDISATNNSNTMYVKIKDMQYIYLHTWYHMLCYLILHLHLHSRTHTRANTYAYRLDMYI